MKTENFVYRFKKAKSIHGLNAFPRLFVKKVHSAIQDKWRLLFRNHNHVYVYDGEPPKVILPEGITVKFYDRIENIPTEAIQKMTEESGDRNKTIDWLNSEFRENSILWLLFVDDSLAGRIFVRYGKFFNKWFLPLNDNDFVFIGGSTFPEYRGQSVHSILMRYSMSHEMQNGGRALTDCKVWNQASMRSCAKCNFRNVKTMKNYWEGNKHPREDFNVYKEIVEIEPT